MCLQPHKIKNPFLGLAHVGLNFLRDCTAQYIEVPCGHCPVCLALKQSYIVQRSQMEAMENDLFFCTLTYNDEMLPVMEVNGYKLKYCMISDFQNMIKRLRRKDAFGLPFRFWAVTEYGGKRHRPHYHCIFAFPKIKGETRAELYDREQRYFKIVLDEWKRNIATRIDENGKSVPDTFNPEYKPLCTFVRRRRANGKLSTTFDFHYIDPTLTDSSGVIHDESDVAFYVTKYTLKASKYVDRLKSALKLNLSPEDFNKAWTVLRPKALVSKKWGNPDSPLVKKHVRKGIDFALEDPDLPYPVFFNPTTGQSFPLAPFYKRKMYTVSDALTMFYKAKEDYGTHDAFKTFQNPEDIKDPVQFYKSKIAAFDKVKEAINNRYEDEEYQFYQLDEHSQDFSSDGALIDDFLDFDSLCETLYKSIPADPVTAGDLYF